MSANEVVEYVKNHRCYSHPIFKNWADVSPSSDSIGALFHQIQSFCASTRPGWMFPEALRSMGLQKESMLLNEIVESEEGHGPELAAMAGFILNAAARKQVCTNVYDQDSVERKLKECSDKILGTLPGYNKQTGLTIQAEKAIEIFEKRKLTDQGSTIENLGVALALEIISNSHLIPGEKHCLVDSGLYGATLEKPEMHYLLEHWGEVGAEQQHEKNVIEAVDSVLNDDTKDVIILGAKSFLDALVSLWDLLDTCLLKSGYAPDKVIAKIAA